MLSSDAFPAWCSLRLHRIQKGAMSGVRRQVAAIKLVLNVGTALSAPQSMPALSASHRLCTRVRVNAVCCAATATHRRRIALL